MELACGGEGGFLPKTREVEHAKRAGDAGADKGNDLAHERRWVGVIGW
jgi:hypothetical protein